MGERREGQQVFDVAIVGFGPSGAVAAALLGTMGLEVWVGDRSRVVYDKPRAIALDHEILRVFQQVGVIDAAMAHVEPFTPSEYLGVDGRLIKRLTMIEPPYPLGYTPSNVFSQPPVEAALRERVAQLPGVCVELGVEVIGMQQDADAVALTLQREDGANTTLRARYVIGCDGASSSVRELSGIGLEDLDFDEPWLVADVLVNERGLAKLPATSVQYCDPERPCTLVIGPKNHRRWEISLKHDEDPRLAATPERTWQLLSRWIGPEDGELWRQASYRFHALVAERWRDRRVFLAGDAAHQQPPFLGQGMCQGVRDVANLAWKLAAVLRGDADGEAGQALLDSYGEERKAHVRELTSRIKQIGALICERNPSAAQRRDAQLLAESGGVVKDTPRQDVLPRLERGMLSRTPHAANGSLFPQPRVRAGASTLLLDRLTGCGWRLLLAADAPLTARPAGLTVVRLDSDFIELDQVLASWMQKHHCVAALVRPDHYVFGVASDAVQLDELVAEWARRMGRDDNDERRRTPCDETLSSSC
jgi:3-(3-hydroxy-phenyl)propionate hydroxylase